MSEQKFVDPIDEIIARHTSDDYVKSETAEVVETSAVEENDDMIDETILDWDDEDQLDIDYGDNDLSDEIRAEEERDEAEREEKRRAYEEAMKEAESRITEGAPNPHDMKKHAEDIGFQAENLAIVSMMLNKVIAKNHIVSGCIPEEKKMAVMGQLLEIYHNHGEEITPEFEEVILKNWVGGTPNNVTPVADTPVENKKEVVEEEEPRNTTININVEPGTPVTVNVDGSVLDEQDRRREINVIVHEVSEKEMRSTTVIENSQLDGIITPYESEATDVPITLPMSAYRCTMGGVSMFDIIKLSAVQNGNPRDMDIKTWSLIYNHMKNPSIGKFKSFDDFLKHTDYRDMELLLWGAFVATADEVETISFTCGNPNCKHHMDFKYYPRTIIHVDEEWLPV